MASGIYISDLTLPNRILYSTKIVKGKCKGKRKFHFRFDSAEPYPIFYKYTETRPISDGFRKNNVNYWAFREIRSIIPHL